MKALVLTIMMSLGGVAFADGAIICKSDSTGPTAANVSSCGTRDHKLQSTK